MNSIVKKRKLEFISIVSEGVKIFFSNAKDFSIIALISIIPISVLFVFEPLGFQPFFIDSDGFASQDTNTFIVKILLLILVFLIQAFVTLITSMSIAIITESIVEDKFISYTKAIQLSVSKWGRAFIASVLANIVIYALSLLFIIPGIIYSLYYVFVLYAVVLRDKYGQEALEYSKKLVQGQWWRVFWILFGVGIIFAGANWIISYLISQISSNVYLNIIGTVFTFFLSTILGIINVVLFLNNDFVYHNKLIKRKELELPTNTKKSLSIKKYGNKTKQVKTAPPKRLVVKKVSSKSNKSKTVAKRKTRKEE